MVHYLELVRFVNKLQKLINKKDLKRESREELLKEFNLIENSPI